MPIERAARRSGELDKALLQLQMDISQGTLALPLLPRVASEVLSSSLDDRSDAARLAELIQQDQSLAGHVLRVVNAPAFRAAQEIVALQQAIARLGLNRIREIAITAALGGSLFSCDAYQHLVDECWRLSLCAGLWAKEFARACRKNVEIGYLCGLLHNIGKPLILNRLSELDHTFSDTDAELLLAHFAAPAGGMLARDWQLPAAVEVTIRHLEQFAELESHQTEVAVAASGVGTARLMLAGSLDSSAVMNLEGVAHLNLYEEDVIELLGETEQIQGAMESMV